MQKGLVAAQTTHPRDFVATKQYELPAERIQSLQFVELLGFDFAVANWVSGVALLRTECANFRL